MWRSTARQQCVFAWCPSPHFGTLTPRRFASTIRLQSDFGPSEKRPPNSAKNVMYVAEPVERKGSFMRYMMTAREEAPYIACAVGAVCLYSAATLSIPAGFGALMDYASQGQMPIGTSTKLLALFGVAGFANFVRLSFVGYAGERCIARLRSRLYRAIIGMPAPFFDDPANRTGALVQRLSLDCNLVGSSLTEALMNGSKNFLQAVGSIGVMLYFSPTMTAAILGMLPPICLFAGGYGRYVRKLQMQMQDTMAGASTIAEERLSAIRTVKAFGQEEPESKWYSKHVDKVLTISKKMVLWNASYVGLLHSVGYIGLYCMIWAGSLLVASGDITAGILFSFMLYMVYCGIGLMGLTNLMTEINKGYGASIRLFDIIDAFESMEAAAKATAKPLVPVSPNFQIDFKNVHFAYPTRPEAQIYSGLSLSVKPSKCTCIVGASGSGKSTLAFLLMKLYTANEGSVLVDGLEIDEVDTAWLRSKVGYVGQEPVLFGGTVAQNILYGCNERQWDDPVDRWGMTQAVEAAKRANAHAFISSLPAGYDTYVGEGGRSLSGGQKQRIAIARALARAPSIVILDEATSALDSESEAVVQEAIVNLIGGARDVGSQISVLMFAHKLSMIRNADHIVVLEEGKVLVEGSFEEVSANATFCQLVGLS